MRSLIIASILILMKIEQVMLRRAAKRPGDRRLIGRVLCSSPHEQAQTDLL